MIALLLIALVQVDYERLVRELGADDLEVRSSAQAALVKAGRQALPALEAASKDQDAERRARANGVIDEIAWGDALWAVARVVEHENTQPQRRRVEARELASDATRRFLPQCRIWVVSCTWQAPTISRASLDDRFLFGRRFEGALAEGVAGLEAAVRDGAIPMRTEEQAADFVEFARFLWPHQTASAVERVDAGWRAFVPAITYGRQRHALTLRVEGDVLKGVALERER